MVLLCECKACFPSAETSAEKRSSYEESFGGASTAARDPAGGTGRGAEGIEANHQFIENGRYNPSIQLAFKLARYFGITVEELFIYEEEEA